MPNPYVTNVTLKNNEVVLTVQVDEYPPGEDLEISGHATQNGGAFAVFNDIQPVPEPNPDGTAYIYVKASPSQKFQKSKAVTVVLRAARVWTTVLRASQSGPEPADEYRTSAGKNGSAGDGTIWKDIRAVTYAAPSSTGNAGRAAAGSGATFQDAT